MPSGTRIVTTSSILPDLDSSCDLILSAVYVVSSILISVLMYKGFSSSFGYCFILEVLNAVCLFQLFLKLKFQNHLINYCAKSCFAIFCIHTSPFALQLWRDIFVTDAHLTVSVVSTFVWMIVSVMAMFAACLLLSVTFRLFLGNLKCKICGILPVFKRDE